jgi:hypothetical protein
MINANAHVIHAPLNHANASGHTSASPQNTTNHTGNQFAALDNIILIECSKATRHRREKPHLSPIRPLFEGKKTCWSIVRGPLLLARYTKFTSTSMDRHAFPTTASVPDAPIRTAQRRRDPMWHP